MVIQMFDTICDLKYPNLDHKNHHFQYCIRYSIQPNDLWSHRAVEIIFNKLP